MSKNYRSNYRNTSINHNAVSKGEVKVTVKPGKGYSFGIEPGKEYVAEKIQYGNETKYAIGAISFDSTSINEVKD